VQSVGRPGAPGTGAAPSTATLVIGTHAATEAALAATVAAVADSAAVAAVTSVLRVEGA
jgi:homoserine dehydrogenase